MAELNGRNARNSSLSVLHGLAAEHRVSSPPFLEMLCNPSWLGKVSIKITLEVMEFSIQILPPPPPLPFDGKKTFIFHNFFSCLYYVYYHPIWQERWRKNCYLLLLKCLEPKSWSQKVRLTAVMSALTPPVMKH